MTPHAESAPPEDPAVLLAVISALRGELADERAARRAAELGLQSKTLEAERRRVLIARLRHERFGRSSERTAAEVEQLELRLDAVLADLAAAGSPELPESEAATTEAKPPPEKEAPGAQAAARQPAAARCRTPACQGLHLSRLRRRVAQGGRGRDGDPGVPPRPVRGGAPRPPRILLPDLRGDDAGAHAHPPDRARATGAGPAGPRARVQVLRPPAPLPAVGDLRPRGCGPAARPAGGLGGQVTGSRVAGSPASRIWRRPSATRWCSRTR